MKPLRALQQVDQGQSSAFVAVGGSLLGLGAVAIAPTEPWLALLAIAGVLIALAQQYGAVRNVESQLDEVEDREARAEVHAHDMRSALLSIEGGAVALRRAITGPVPERTDSIAAAIQAETGRIRELIERQVEMPEPGVASQLQQCSVNATIEPILNLRRAAGHDIVSILAADAIVTMSSTDLGRCVSNMIDNCVEHAPRSSIEISGFVRRGNYELSVGDHGPGFLESLLDDAFEPRVSSRPGGGLGLYSVREIAEQAGGRVSIDTSPRGTTVHVAIPVVARAKKETARRARMSASG